MTSVHEMTFEPGMLGSHLFSVDNRQPHSVAAVVNLLMQTPFNKDSDGWSGLVQTACCSDSSSSKSKPDLDWSCTGDYSEMFNHFLSDIHRELFR